MTKASAVSSWPIDASATAGKASISGGRFSRFRSWPMLTTRPSSAARAAVAAQALQQCRMVAVAEGGGVGTGVDLDAVGPGVVHRCDRGGVGIDEQDDAAAERLELVERGVDKAVLRGIELPALLRGEGFGAVGHQGALLRLHLGDDVEKAAVGIAFEVELESRAPRQHQLGEPDHIAAADVALVRAGMRSQPVGAGPMRDPAKAQDVRHAGAPRVAQQRDLVEIDAEPGHRRLFRCGEPLPIPLRSAAVSKNRLPVARWFS